ncbi:MAG: PKD domain-containing protein [Planctomycetes bacterium]|nr:PKD domain-containing protein [Planctomycetota bacterium]
MGLVSAAVVFLSLAGTARADVNDSGYIVDWLVYAPLSTAVGCCPDAAGARLDYLTDGAEFFESTIKPVEGLEMVPDFNGASAATGFHPILADAVADWRRTNTLDPAGDGTVANANPDTVDFNLIYAPTTFNSANQGCPAPVENAMGHAVVYLKNGTGSPIQANLQLGSDDSIQVKLDDCEVFFRSIGRGFGGAGTIQDRVAVTIPTGSHRLLAKVWNGCGGFGFRLRLLDAASGLPANLTYDIDPDALQVPEIQPEGTVLDVYHTATPDRLIGFDNAVTLSITGVKADPGLPDATVVTVRETLIPGTTVVPGSATPAPTSQEGATLTWQIPVGDLVASGIRLDFKFGTSSCGGDTSGCLSGEFSLAGSGCVYPISGKACSVAVPLTAIFLGDIVGGGDGSGTKAPEIGGVRLDMDQFLATDEIPPENNRSSDVDDPATPDDESQIPFQIIESIVHPNYPDIDLTTASDFIDGTFFIPVPTVQINTAGVEFEFAPDDPQPDGSWNHILSNVTHDIDKGVGNIRVAGKEPFATGVGVHASAGVTFDLNAIRAKYGAEKVKNLGTLAGVDGCGAGNVNCGLVNLYIIYSTENEVLTDFTWAKQFDTDQGEEYFAPIPEEAAFVSFATGRAGGSDCCDHGVYAEARIFPELPDAVIMATPESGPVPLTVSFDASRTVVPPGETISCYSWDFGDGQTATGVSVSHTYTARGKYTARLAALTEKGLSSIPATKEITASFACGDVSPFVSADVGAPSLAGCARQDGGCLVVFGGGKDIALKSDQFQLVSKEKTGNVTLTARITKAVFDNISSGRGGLMFRAGTAADAAFACIQANAGLGGALKVAFQSRVAAGQTLASKTSPSVPVATPDIYLKLERNGAELIGSYSTNGTDYTEFHRITLTAPPDAMLAGLAVTARDSASRGSGAEVTFCDVKYSDEVVVPEDCSTPGDEDKDGKADCADEDCAALPECQPKGGFHRGDADNNGQLQLTDAIRILGFLFLGGLPPTCMDAADADGNNQLQLTDAIRILGYLFLGGVPPETPGPPPNDCGPDNDAVNLGCELYDKC